MTCVLRVFGPDLDVDALLRSSSLEPVGVFRRGERRYARSKPSEQSGVNIDVSDADLSDLEIQVQDTVSFLIAHSEDVAALVSFPGVVDPVLDFAVEWRDSFTHSDRLPSSLIRVAGELGLSIQISHYPVDNSSLGDDE